MLNPERKGQVLTSTGKLFEPAPPVDPPTPPPVDPPTPPPVAPSSDADFFFSFTQGANTPAISVDNNAIGSTGSLLIFGDEDLDFNQLDLDFTNDNPSVVSFTGGVVFNPGAAADGIASDAPGGNFTSFSLLNPAPPADGSAFGVTETDGRLFATSFLSAGQIPGSGASNFDAGAGGFLLAEVEFDIIGAGTANFSFIPGDLGVENDPAIALEVDLSGVASFTVEVTPVVGPGPGEGPGIDIPEPSSAILLILGAAGMAARRRRS